MNLSFVNTKHLETSKTSKILNRKLFFFLTCSIVFGSLSFVSYKPVEASKNDYSFALVNNSKTPLEILDNSLSILDTEKSNPNIVSSPLSSLNNTKLSENQFALIVGTYKKKYNAVNLETEMKKKGFKDCRIISDNNLKKYWVTIDLYKDKNDAKIAREKYLLDGWIKQI
jgi:cell division protein FtsN